MPKLPDAQSLGIVEPQPGRQIATYQGGIEESGAQAAGAGIANIGKGLQTAGMDYLKAQDLGAASAADSAFLTGKVALDQKYAQDAGDWQTRSDRYGADLQALAATQAQTIRGTEARTQFLNTTLRYRAFGMEAQQRAANQQRVGDAQAKLTDMGDETVKNILSATDQSTRDGLQNSYRQSIDAAVATGVITAQTGEHLKQKLPKVVSNEFAKTLVNTDPVVAARLLAPGAPSLAAALPADLGASIHGAALRTNANEDTLARTAQIERSATQSTNPLSSASGDFGFLASTAAQYGGSDAMAAAKLQNDNRLALKNALGRAPTEAEVYLAHQQGAAGAAALITRPNFPAIDALKAANIPRAEASILNNGGKASMTAGDFAGMWAQKFASRPGMAGMPRPANDTGGPADAGAGPTADPTSPGGIFPKTGDWRDDLDPATRAQLYRVATDRAKGVNAEARSELGYRLSDAMGALEAGKEDVDVPTLAGQARALLPHAKAEEVVAQLNVAQGAGIAFKGVQWGSPQALADARADLASGTGVLSTAVRLRNRQASGGGVAEGADETADANSPAQFGLRQKLLAKFDAMVQQRQTVLNTDPRGYVEQSPGVQAARAASPNDPQAVMRASLTAQEQLGVPEYGARVLSNADVAQKVAAIKGMDPAKGDVGMQLDQLGQSYGDLWPKAFGELVHVGKLPPEYQVIATMTEPGQVSARQDVQRALQMVAEKGGLEKMKEAAPKAVVQDIDKNIGVALNAFQQTTRWNAGGEELFANVQNTAKMLAYRYAFQGQTSGEAIQHAVTGILDAKYDFDGTMRVPKGMLPQVQAATDSVQSALTPADLAPTPGNPNLTQDERQAELVTAVRRGSWVPNHDDTGLALMLPLSSGMRPARAKDGTPIEVKFGALPAVPARVGLDPNPRGVRGSMDPNPIGYRSTQDAQGDFEMDEDVSPYGRRGDTVDWRPGDPTPDVGTKEYEDLKRRVGTVDDPKRSMPDRVVDGPPKNKNYRTLEMKPGDDVYLTEPVYGGEEGTSFRPRGRPERT